MAFTYDPQETKENVFQLLPEGEYSFETISCLEGETKDGRDKLVLSINVFDNEGSKWKHTMHITTNNTYHLKSYWDSVGIPEMFEKMSKKHDENEFFGKCGSVKTKLEDNEWEGKKQKRSVISYFIKKSEKPKKEDKFIDDDIPF